ncbi:homoserine dehydrogenase [Kistimonas scapharcae]|uniref:Homoserine dehydrogenase n=1 Tax=Kistimonas scapharcae TaxID=1036133 RepID=A0ABP8UWX5_9GAMM
MKPVRVGICGLGTVGSGTVNVLVRNREEIARRLGRSVEIEQIGARRDNPACDTTGMNVTRDIFDVANNPDVDVLVELIGGYDTAKQLVLTAIANGKHVVTANKALIAEHGNEIFAAAREQGVIVAYEAGVAGGIPAIKALREGLSANKIQWLAGIINGTGNFILTEMRDKGSPFADVLKQAQELGYAEADPTFDVEGIDAAHKLTILASNAFGIPLHFDKAYTEGISAITPRDIQYATELGYRMKHLGIARRRGDGVELRVHPTLVPAKHLLASVDGVMNAVLMEGDAVGQTLYYGPGAGSDATASAVIADILDVARLLDAPTAAVAPLGFVESDQQIPVLPIDKIHCSYYLRLHVSDQPGVLTRVTEILSHNGINIDALMQKEVREGDGCADIVILTHETLEAIMDTAIIELEQLADVTGSIIRIRVDHLEM